ncbi:MAG: hypothetical protein Q8W48_10245 [Candidatus Palauibacterales bacterium]|nr:hypothetical protein [Candidatus Palauibacterales bacterium]
MKGGFGEEGAPQLRISAALRQGVMPSSSVVRSEVNSRRREGHALAPTAKIV